MELKQHTVKSYDKDLYSIVGTIDHLFDLLNDSITIVENAINNPNKNLVEQISANDYKINHLDNLIEKKVTSMLALRQPFAFDLRFIISALRVSANLERAGDKCKSTVKKIVKLDKEISQNTKDSLLQMLDISRKMIQNSITSFNNHDVDIAQNVLNNDDKIDDLYKQLFSIAEGKNFNQQQVKDIVGTLFIAKNFERLADHATNIAEMVEYVISGEIVEK